MSRNHFILASAALLMISVPPSELSAQIDYRVNQGNAATAGRANDANPAIGSGGLNQPVSRFDAGGYSNAVITGNVTGLARFQGFSPIPQANQFRGPLPSADLSLFRATTVGVNDVTANRTSASGRYYDVQTTISDVGFIRSGVNLPGSSALASPNIVPPSVTTPLPPVGLRPLPIMTDLRVDQLSNQALGLIQQEQIAPVAGQLIGPGVSDWRYRSAADSSIFGMPPLTPLQRLRAREGGFPTMPPGAEPGQPLESEAINQRLGVIGEEMAPMSPGEKALTDAEGYGVHNTNALAERRPGVPVDQRGLVGEERVGSKTPAGTLGEDRFSDLFRAVQTAQQMGVKKLGFEAVEAGKPEPLAPGVATIGAAPSTGEPAPAVPVRRRMLRHPSTDALADLATAAKWANDLLENPVTSFAGRYGNQLNQYLETGEEALRKGEYYRAAAMFDLAHTIDPRNPLPLLHKGHALLAAGDYMSAAVSLQQGIARFPQIAAFRIDLPALGGSVYDVRRADLERKLQNSDQCELRFLLGYMELYSGLPEEGIRDLELAAKTAPPESMIAIFADLVTNRRELPPLP
jgi:tetratricopeptide (TPR) repeat protein